MASVSAGNLVPEWQSIETVDLMDVVLVARYDGRPVIAWHVGDVGETGKAGWENYETGELLSFEPEIWHPLPEVPQRPMTAERWQRIEKAFAENYPSDFAEGWRLKGPQPQ
jgi:hypothetical protein